MRAWLAAACAACWCAALFSLSLDAEAEDDASQNTYETDAAQRRFRVGFDPESRLLVGGGYAPRVATTVADETTTAYVEAALFQRHRIDYPEDGVAWKLGHRILETRLWMSPDHDVRVTATAYEGQFMRWSRDGQIFFPPNTQAPFPLDIGFATTLGQVDYRPLGSGTSLDINALRSEVVLGFLRLRTLRTHLRLGVGPSYGLRVAALDRASSYDVSHLVAPFTSASFRAHHESADGLHAFDLVARASYTLRVDAGWALSVDARLHYELVMVAVNDLPVSTYLEAGYAHFGDPPSGRGEHELITAAGMRFSIPVDTTLRAERASSQ